MNTSSCSAGLRGLIASAIFGALAAGFSAVSAADPSSAAVTVKYSDLNLASPSGARVLYERIHAAAEKVCAPLDHGDVLSRQHEHACIGDLVARGVANVNSPALRALYDTKNGIPVPGAVTATR